MRWWTGLGLGLLLAPVWYSLLGWMVYDFSRPTYMPESDPQIDYEVTIEGVRYWNSITRMRFSGYEPGVITNWFRGERAAYHLYFWIEPVFHPLAEVVRRCQGDAYRAEAHEPGSDASVVFRCGNSYDWVVLEP